MKLFVIAGLTALSLLPGRIAAQARAEIPFSDPANLRRERVEPRDGRELPIDQGALGLQQMLRRLSTRASLMLIVAHPDDEDGGMLTYYSRGLGARVAMLTLNRGEGGQNAMTGDFEDALGLLRTQELLAADRYMGVDQMFGTEVDFGFSKTKEESFNKWTHERVLYDAVRAVRLYRPLVIASVFIGGVTDGHGQHQVSGEITQEVFKAAGDPKVFPELTAEGILPWQPLRVYARVPLGAITSQGLFDYATGQYAPARFVNYVTGEVSTSVPSSDVVVHEGTHDPLLTRTAASQQDLSPAVAALPSDAPLSYVQFARIGLGLQRSQIGPGFRTPPAGAFDVAYHLYGATGPGANADPHQPDFFADIDTSLAGCVTLATDAPPTWKTQLAAIGASIADAQHAFTSDHPERTIPGLRSALRQLDALLITVESSSVRPDSKANLLHELRVKRVQLNDALLLAHGIVTQPEPTAATKHADGLLLSTDTRLDVTLSARNGGVTRIDFMGARLRLAQGTAAYQITPFDRFPASSLSPGESTAVTLGADLPHGLPVTRPYFSRDSIEQPYYTTTAALRNAPQTPWPVTAELTFSDDSLLLNQSVVLHSTGSEQPLMVVPPAAATFSVHTQVRPSSESSFLATIRTSPAPSATAGVHLEIPAGWRAESAGRDTPRPEFTVYRVQPLPDAAASDLRASVDLSGVGAFSEWWRPVGYGNLPRTNYLTPATDRIVPVDMNLPTHGRIAYLPGTGDDVAAILSSLRLPTTEISVADLTVAGLSRFDTVVLGVRTYNAHPDLHGAPTQALLEFVRNGGNVLVQYQTAEFTGSDAPFPLTLGSAEKVVDETTPVQLLDPSSSILSSPNKITEADFDGWVEERGHGFLQSWDPRYAAPTETHDPGSAREGIAPQSPQRGGLVTVTLGAGHWTYCAFALYRQLPEAVPGAYRLLGNILALADEHVH